jgi:tRNA G10  N-methylase Trm11
MCGIGSFLIVAALKGYDGIGVELEKTFYDDIVGFDQLQDDDSFFSGHVFHIEGVLEKFRRVNQGRHVGEIRVYNHDARLINELLPLKTGAKVICSPPYGNRLEDEKQNFGSKTNMTFAEIRALSSKQYSTDSNNIGNSKIKVISSRPYSRNTEHDESQIDSMKDYDTGHTATTKDDDYRREMRQVYKALYSVLQPGTVVCLVTRNFIHEGQIVYLDLITQELMFSAGFKFLEVKRAVLPDISFFKLIQYQRFHKAKGLPLIDWEEAQFFIKE